MDAAEQINQFKDFFEKIYFDSLVENISQGKKFININFNDISQYYPDLADSLLEMPEDVIKAGEKAVEQLDIEGDTKKFKTRFTNLPESQHLRIRDIRSSQISKFIQLEGIVRQKSDIRPKVTTAKFECPSCGNTIFVLQTEHDKFKEPTKCGCGRKGAFRLIDKELVDVQKIVLEECPEELEGSEQPKRLNIFLQSDLVSPISDKRTNPGSKIRVVGILKEIPIILATGGRSTRFDLMLDTNYVEPIQEDFYDIRISKEDKKAILELSEEPQVYKKLINSIAPTIYGHDKVKEALLLQLLGGYRKTVGKGSSMRGDMHVLLIGDPGSGKSQLLKRVGAIAPKARYVTGKGASGTGLTATVVKDEFLRGWALEAGALVLANKGICCIDELDKMSKEDRSAMHEALEQQTITIAKANIQATLMAETTVLAAANPKFGRFDPFQSPAEQIDLPSTLINRFDLIFPIRDLPDKTKDDKLASFILSLHKQEIMPEEEVDPDLLKKYISYARQNIKPQLTDVAMKELKEYYVKMRNAASDEQQAIKAIPISARQLEALVRLAEASARTRLSQKVTKKDARIAIELVHFCLSQIGVDPETGKIDIDRITTGISASQRSHIVVVREVINELERTMGKEIPIEDIVRQAEIRGVSKEKTEEVIEKLNRSGDVFKPRPGLITKV